MTPLHALRELCDPAELPKLIADVNSSNSSGNSYVPFLGMVLLLTRASLHRRRQSFRVGNVKPVKKLGIYVLSDLTLFRSPMFPVGGIRRWKTKNVIFLRETRPLTDNLIVSWGALTS